MPPSEGGWLPIADKLIREFEGFEKPLGATGNFIAYKCPAGIWTIGIGSTGPDIKQGTVWTRPQCEAHYLHDLLTHYGPAVDKLLIHQTPDREKAALVSFCYNLGEGKLKASTLLRVHNDGNRRAAADQFLKWVYANGKPLRGLVKRREAERAVYLGIPR